MICSSVNPLFFTSAILQGLTDIPISTWYGSIGADQTCRTMAAPVGPLWGDAGPSRTGPRSAYRGKRALAARWSRRSASPPTQGPLSSRSP
jgi:hypothetical protein